MNLDALRDILASDATRRAEVQEETIKELQARVEKQSEKIIWLEAIIAQQDALLKRAGLIKCIGARQLLRYFWLSANFNFWDWVWRYCERCGEKQKNQ